MHGVGSKTVQARQRQRLNQINEMLLPRFQYRKVLKSKLANIDDPIVEDMVQEQVLSIRNEVCETMIQDPYMAGMLDAIASRWAGTFRNGEAKSFVYENLLEAADRYDPDVKPYCKFTSFFWLYNQNIMKNHVKRLKADKRDVGKTDSLDALRATFEDDEGVSLKEFIVSDDNLEHDLSNHLALKELFRMATPKQRLVLKRLYLGIKQNEIAKRLQISGTNVNMTIQQIRMQYSELMA